MTDRSVCWASSTVFNRKMNNEIYIIGSHRLSRELMAAYLEKEYRVTCNLAEDPSKIPGHESKSNPEPRIILVDAIGKNRDDCQAYLDSMTEHTFVRDHVILFNVTPGLGIEEKALRRGARGFFYGGENLSQFVKGVHAVSEGELWVSRDIMSKCIMEEEEEEHPAGKKPSLLTPREIEILSMVALGVKNEDIADRLCISPNTVKTHIYNIFKKIDVPNRLQAALWAAKNL